MTDPISPTTPTDPFQWLADQGITTPKFMPDLRDPDFLQYLRAIAEMQAKPEWDSDETADRSGDLVTEFMQRFLTAPGER